ncbi:hypothetical protein I317_05655 [Kwoniella heveanensis CBS 569]|uniref:Copper acquisition factor BIM1-like domain-containing protein n=1 Tax=Kwoniella heveanensis BCC8398 TaxID=1296120 RepID=A0A1B9GMR2_9TREE|nr:hypothetical protein I316_05939 [Kwoniella heveanensis BCC8398]OCF40564.1 hypothetical protein I317_05655 [Kwoniella heveanensis CBS 569]
MLASAVLISSVATLASAATISPRQGATISQFETSPVEFTYPPPRSGYSPDTAATYPCGGSAAGSRTNYPLTGGQLALDVDTLAANVNLMYANETDPDAFHDFSTFTNTILDVSDGSWCGAAPNFTELGLEAGNDVTLLVIYQLYGNSSYLYHCADLTLVEAGSYTAPSDLACSNSSVILETASPEDSLVLKGSNYSAAQEGVDGQTVSVDLAAVTAASASSGGSASAAATSAAATSSSGAEASASASASAAGGSSAAGLTASVGITSVLMAAVGTVLLL